MQKNPSTLRNSLDLIIGKSLLERLRVDKDITREVSTTAEALLIRLLRRAGHEPVRAAADRTDYDRAKANGKRTRCPRLSSRSRMYSTST